MVEICLATGITPSEYRRLSFMEYSMFHEVYEERNTSE